MKNTLKNLICKRISYLRQLKGLTIEQLAYQSGISKGGLSEIERNKKMPNLFTISKICACLNIDIKEFFNCIDIDNFINRL